MAVAPPVARAPLVLADDDLLTEHVSRDLCRHLLALQLVAEPRPAVTSEEEEIWVERLPLVDGHTVHEQPLALADAVLLAADGDHCICGLFGHYGHPPNGSCGTGRETQASRGRRERS